MSRTRWIMFTICLLACIGVAAGHSLAQQGGRGPGRGPGGKGKGDWDRKGKGGQPWKKGGGGDVRLPQLTIEDVKPDGFFEVLSLLPGTNDQPRIGLTDKLAYRLVNYEAATHSLKFVTLDLVKNALAPKTIKLPPECPNFHDQPRMAYDCGQFAVITQQAATVFVDVVSGKVKVAAGFDTTVATGAPAPRPRDRRRDWRRDQPELPAQAYRVHAGAGGMHALSVLVNYDRGSKQYSGDGAKLHFADGKSVNLSWPHAKHGVPPKDRDGVFAVTADEIIVVVTQPRTPGDFNSSHEMSCLVFDHKGELKTVQTAPGNWHGGNATRSTISPDGKHLVAHPEDSLHRFVITRGTWERGYKTEYHDACIGFAPEGGVGVFIESFTPQRAALKAVKLDSGEVLWTTSVPHEDVQGDDEDEPFFAVGPGGASLAARYGIIAGVTSETPTYLYTAKVVDFEPLSMSYDSAGKLIAALALDRVFIVDARTSTEVASISFEKPLPAGSLGEFVTFDAKSTKVLACVRNQGCWLIDLTEKKIEKSIAPIPGTFARALPDLSGVVYSAPTDQGGNVMIQRLDVDEPQRLYRCEYKDTLAVCLWVSDKGDEFLITERQVGEGKLFIVDDKGEKRVEYDVADVDTTYCGDNCVTAFVTRGKEAVLINEVNRFGYTGINCAVISPSGEPVSKLFTGVFQTDDLPGRSTYGLTAASPFFGAQFWGNEKLARFACPAGVLEADISRGNFKLYAWSRKPSGIAAINPRGREFFVAGSVGLTTYRLK